MNWIKTVTVGICTETSLSLPARESKTDHWLSTDKYSKMEFISASIFTIQIWKWISGKTDWKEFDLEMRVRFFITFTENLMWVWLHHLNVIGYALRGKSILCMGISSYFYLFLTPEAWTLSFNKEESYTHIHTQYTHIKIIIFMAVLCLWSRCLNTQNTTHANTYYKPSYFLPVFPNFKRQIHFPG